MPYNYVMPSTTQIYHMLNYTSYTSKHYQILLLFKVFNNKIPKRDWLNLYFQIINTSRQTLFEIQNCSVYNILSKQLSGLNRKLQKEWLSFISLKLIVSKLFFIEDANFFSIWSKSCIE